MEEMDLAGLTWSEETVTEISLPAGLPYVKPVVFNRPQESAVGADWLWWWLDLSSGVCFGMLVQAKRVKGGAGKWTVDVSHGGGVQRESLMAVADLFEVPAVYCVYMGGPSLREGMGCTHGGVVPCQGCTRMAITLMPALSLPLSRTKLQLFDLTVAEGVPLEDLGDTARPAGVVKDVNFRQLAEGSELRAFLTEEQRGPSEIAKQIFRSVSIRRANQKSAAVAERLQIVGEQVFLDLPGDRGHFGVPYFPHVLRGLRMNPPNYVRDLLAGMSVPSEVSEAVAGVVLIAM
ncbi:hypothetical protein JNB_01645 [Janibacter sp. HTCC2649]|nr:hypothetical protein JNB_01645 [Janibacter sp. HTCC2649]